MPQTAEQKLSRAIGLIVGGAYLVHLAVDATTKPFLSLADFRSAEFEERSMNTLLVTMALIGVAFNCLLSIVLVVKLRRSQTSADDVRSELRLGRDEARAAAKETREDLGLTMRAMSEALRDQSALQQNHFVAMANQQKGDAQSSLVAAEALRNALDARAKTMQEVNESKFESIRSVLDLLRETVDKKLGDVREEIATGLKANTESSVETLSAMMTTQVTQLGQMTKQMTDLSETNHGTLERIRVTFDGRIQDLQAANDKKFDEMRQGVSHDLKQSTDSLEKNVQVASTAQKTQLESMQQRLKEFSAEIQGGLDKIRQSLESSVREMRDGNEQKLEQMRKTVDEKLQDTLERRLGESFKFVSERLELVHKGLGEMQSLAAGVGDLKRVLTNVKVRGTLAEVQLGGILEQVLTPEQYAKNVAVNEGSLERVEYAIRLPGPKEDPGSCMWLPIDSKFPKEDFIRLQGAAEAGDPNAVQGAVDALLRALRVAAKDIHDKYINPPSTTDYAVMFLATEGLYAEALRQPQFIEEMLQKYRVLVAGPMTLAAILSSLRMGFQTLMVEQRAAEVWRVLGAVKTEFGKFGGVLDKVQRQLQTASRTIEETGTRTRAMERRLRSVGQLDSAEAATVLALPSAAGFEGDQADDEDHGDELMPPPALDLKPTGTGSG